MGIPDSTLVDLIEKVRSWISWGNSDSNSASCEFKMTNKNCKACCQCEENTLNSCINYHCQSCGRIWCGKCVHISSSKCKLCFELGPISKSARKYSSKVHPSESPRQSPDRASPSFSGGDELEGHSSHDLIRTNEESFSGHLSPFFVRRSSSRSDEDEAVDSTKNFFDISSEYFHDTCDVDSVCSARHDFNGFISLGSSPSDSSSRIHIISKGVGHSVQRERGSNSSSRNDGSLDQEQVVLEEPAKGYKDPEKIDDLSMLQNKDAKLPEPFNFETSGLIWIPPPPHDIADEEENSCFALEDDDDEIHNSGAKFSSDFGHDSMLFAKEKPHLNHKEPFTAVVLGHFGSLVFRLLQAQGLVSTEENFAEKWLNIITKIAWNAANFIKPDTDRGGSMDPCDYVKVKCIASGSPSESKLIKGVACSKNIKHKRMISQYRNTRLLILGGSLEYQRIPGQLASFDTLLQQENDHLKTIVSKIEAHRPNVLLVEKSVSSFAQDQLLAKEISLVLNVKRPLLERIARCSGATITPSTDRIPGARLGHCELFHLEKITEEHEPVNQFKKRPSKTLMFFEGFPRRSGCTVLLRGSSKEELKRVKNVVQYAVFAAYHLLLETSFLADEGATLPKIGPTAAHDSFDVTPDNESEDLQLEHSLQESLSELEEVGDDDFSIQDEFRYRKALSDACDENLALNETLDDHMRRTIKSPRDVKADDASEYYSANDGSQSILVSFSSHCILNGTICVRPRLLRVKFYGPSDKPLGRFIREDLFDETFFCQSCNESTEAHSICYTHQHGNVMINIRRLPSVRLPGEGDGKIWMWHRCLRCTHVEGVPPATPRLVMSDAAWGLSFGKFLELSFLNHATGNRVASCGHSLQRDCLRFYGFGSMVACFQYSPINILSVRLPPAILEFCSPGEQSWIDEEASELLRNAEAVYAEISDVFQEINRRSLSFTHELSDAYDLHGHVLEISDMLAKEEDYFKGLLRLPNRENQEQNQSAFDILEINRLRHSLLISSRFWNRQLYLLDSLLRKSSSPKALNDVERRETYPKDFASRNLGHEDVLPDHRSIDESPTLPYQMEKCKSGPSLQNDYILPLREWDEVVGHEGNAVNSTSLERLPSAGSILSDQIDSAWCGAGQILVGVPLVDAPNGEVYDSISARQSDWKDNPSFGRLVSPTRVHSFDSAQMIQQRMSPPSLLLPKFRSFHASGDYRHMLRDPVSKVQRSFSHASPHDDEKLNLTNGPSFVSFPSIVPKGARLMAPLNGKHDVVVTVYDNEPTSILSYALSSKEYADLISDIQNSDSLVSRANSTASDLSTWQSCGSLDLDYTHFSSYTSEDASSTPKSSPHVRISFEDECSTSGKTRFHVTCYFAKQFDMLRRRCCPNDLDLVRSLSRCRRWSAQGGKSNVYFAKSFDERFVIKQVTKTELDSFQEFSSEYFKHVTDALISGSPTCLAKILGMYQVTVKPSKGGKETKMDLMVMENLFFKKSISKVYDLKGSARSRYNPDTTGANKVLLDANLLETLRTNPIFLGSKAKRKLERAVWNDTSFLASVGVMDYSLLVGLDEEKKELVVGIIDYMRQYTWDKHLETWVKTSGILGGPKNASPTIVSPKLYKKRFRKAITTYFLTLPDQWPS